MDKLVLVEVPCEVNMCKICYNKKIDFGL